MFSKGLGMAGAEFFICSHNFRCRKPGCLHRNLNYVVFFYQNTALV